MTNTSSTNISVNQGSAMPRLKASEKRNIAIDVVSQAEVSYGLSTSSIGTHCHVQFYAINTNTYVLNAIKGHSDSDTVASGCLNDACRLTRNFIRRVLSNRKQAIVLGQLDDGGYVFVVDCEFTEFAEYVAKSFYKAPYGVIIDISLYKQTRSSKRNSFDGGESNEKL